MSAEEWRTPARRDSKTSGPIELDGAAPPLLGARTPESLEYRYRMLNRGQICDAVHSRLRVRPTAVRPVEDGYGGAVYLLKTGTAADLVLKAQLFSDVDELEKEVLFFELVRSSGLPVPVPVVEVIDASGDHLPCKYYVARRLPGRSLTALLSAGAEPSLAAAARRMGHLLSLVHAIRPDACNAGEPQFTFGGRSLPVSRILGRPARPFRKSDWLEDFERRLHRVAALGILPQSLLKAWHYSVLEQCPSFDLVLLHADPTPRNFLFYQGRCTGLIDGSARIGGRETEVAAALVFLRLARRHGTVRDSTAAERAFLDGYARNCGADGAVFPSPALIAERIVNRVDTYARLGQLAGVIPLLLGLWEEVAARRGRLCAG